MTETSLRLGFFLGILLIMLLLENYLPARQSKINKRYRWTGNFTLLIVSSITAKLVLPLGVVGVAIYCTEYQLGLFNVVNLPYWLSVVIGVVLLDLLIYWQHRLFHVVPWLWRLHKVHHADSHVDASTGLRFHPIEIVLSILLKALWVFILGIPAVAVIIFEIALNGFALFNHANIRLPKSLEVLFRKIIITQELHRIHHSQVVSETNSNYGFSVVFWDRIFGSYRARAKKHDRDIDIGLKEWPATNSNASLLRLLTMPFKNKSK